MIGTPVWLTLVSWPIYKQPGDQDSSVLIFLQIQYKKNGESELTPRFLLLNYSGRAWSWNPALSNGLIGMPMVEPSGSLPINHLS